MALKKDGAATGKLRERIRPALRLQGRETVDPVIYEASAPNAICVCGGVSTQRAIPPPRDSRHAGQKNSGGR
jgi:hypothetical protein